MSSLDWIGIARMPSHLKSQLFSNFFSVRLRFCFTSFRMSPFELGGFTSEGMKGKRDGDMEGKEKIDLSETDSDGPCFPFGQPGHYYTSRLTIATRTKLKSVPLHPFRFIFLFSSLWISVEPPLSSLASSLESRAFSLHTRFMVKIKNCTTKCHRIGKDEPLSIENLI